jgi:nucleoid-associated protein YgaU
MAHETRIGMLVGMGFIVCFAIILSNRGGLDRVAPQMPYQLFGEPAAAPSRTAGSDAQESARGLHSGAAPEPVIPQPLRSAAPGHQTAPSRGRPLIQPGENDPERFIQRRRSLLPTRELAERGTPAIMEEDTQDPAPSGDDVGDHEDALALEEEPASPEELATADRLDPTEAPLTLTGNLPDNATENAPTGDSTGLPAALVNYADQLEVVTSRSPGREAVASEAAKSPAEPAPSDPEPVMASHMVEKGDTLSHIAKRHYGSAGKDVIAAIMAANRGKLRSAQSLTVGHTLLLPVVEGRAPSAALARNQVDEARPAQSPADASRGKKPKPATRPAGKTEPVAMPEPGVVLTSRPVEAVQTDGASAEPEWRWYTVKKGDLFSTIAQEQLGTSRRWKELLDLNKDVCPSARQLRTGVRIRIPSGALADAR